jgi:hypothetical protein
MADVFLSYASEDRERARAIADALSSLGWSVWWDRQILPGETFESVIERELAKADCVLVLWSRFSVQSHWARAEADEALHRGVLVPAMIDDVRIPIAFRHVQATSLIDWTPDAADHPGFGMLVRAIRNLDVPNTGEFSGLTGAATPTEGALAAGQSPAPRRQPAAASYGAEPASPQMGKGSKGFIGGHPRALVVAGLALVVVGALIGASVMNAGGGDLDATYDETLADTPSEDSSLDTAAPSGSFASRAPEAINAGYAAVIDWTEDLRTAGDTTFVDVQAQPGGTYHVLGRTTPDCDLDIHINDSLYDNTTSPDATVQFYVDEPATITLRMPVFSGTATQCAIGLGVYRQETGA